MTWFVTKEQMDFIKERRPDLIDNTTPKELYGVKIYEVGDDDMPYKSEAQRKWAHTKEGTKALGGKKKVQEWDRTTGDKKLPKYAKKKK